MFVEAPRVCWVDVFLLCRRNSSSCGVCYQVTGIASSTTVVVSTSCPGCPTLMAHFDMSEEASLIIDGGTGQSFLCGFSCFFFFFFVFFKVLIPEILLSVGEKFRADTLRTYWWKSTILQFVAETLIRNSSCALLWVWFDLTVFVFLNSSVQAVTIFEWVSSLSWKRAGNLPETILVKIMVCGTLIRLLFAFPIVARMWSFDNQVISFTISSNTPMIIDTGAQFAEPASVGPTCASCSPPFCNNGQVWSVVHAVVWLMFWFEDVIFDNGVYFPQRLNSIYLPVTSAAWAEVRMLLFFVFFSFFLSFPKLTIKVKFNGSPFGPSTAVTPYGTNTVSGARTVNSFETITNLGCNVATPKTQIASISFAMRVAPGQTGNAQIKLDLALFLTFCRVLMVPIGPCTTFRYLRIPTLARWLPRPMEVSAVGEKEILKSERHLHAAQELDGICHLLHQLVQIQLWAQHRSL